jgi:hypothetical protein
MIKKVCKTGFFLILSGCSLFAQYTGIGVSVPSYNLDVSGNFRIQHQNGNTTAGLWMDGSTTIPLRSFIGTFNSDHFGWYGQNAGWNFLINNNNDNVGIGGITPDYRLDINGRIRLQNFEGATAGIWFDGSSLPARSFIGNINDDYIGIWGSGGTGWNFAMNVTNGNTGIGTVTPTAKLDLNGNLRLRSNTPVKGSILTCNDVNGNAEWTNPVAFRAESLVNHNGQNCPFATWTKVNFHNSPAYNIGLAYQTNTSVFIAPTNGIYELNSSVAFASYANTTQSIRIIILRNGVQTSIGQVYNKGIYRNSLLGNFYEPAMISTEYNLLEGDQVWVEVWMTSIYSNEHYIASDNSATWFSGKLVTKL